MNEQYLTLNLLALLANPLNFHEPFLSFSLESSLNFKTKRAAIRVAWHISYSIDVILMLILRTKLELFVNVLCWVARQFGEPILKSPVSYISKVQTVAIIASRNEPLCSTQHVRGFSLA